MATYYISTAGNDTTGDGSYALPWLTVSKAHTAASSGDVIIVKTSATTYTFASQTFTKSLTIRGETTNPLNHIFDGGGSSINGWKANNTALAITVEYCTFQNATTAANETLFFSNLAAGGVCTMNNCIVRTITMNNGDYDAIFGANAANGGRGSIDISLVLVYGLVRGAAGTNGAILNRFASEVGTDTVTNCTFAVGTTGYKIYRSVTGSVLTLKNSIFYSDSSLAFGLAAGGTINYSYSCSYNFTSPPSGTGNITSDPLFVDAANSNYNLRPASPCIDSATLI